MFVENFVLANNEQRTLPNFIPRALCVGIPPVTGGFPTQKASNAESVSGHDLMMTQAKGNILTVHYCVVSVLLV